MRSLGRKDAVCAFIRPAPHTSAQPRRSSGESMLFAADCKTLAPLRPSPLQHQASILRAHPHQKSMCLLPAPRVRLKRSLSLHAIPLQASLGAFARDVNCSRLAAMSHLLGALLEPTVNRSERVQQVSIMVAFVLQSASFTVGLYPKPPHGCLVSSRSFPHLWKKLWKITIFADSSLFLACLSPIRRGRNPGKAFKHGLGEP